MFTRKKKQNQQIARKIITSINPNSTVSEQFRTIRTNINFLHQNRELRTLLFTSTSIGEGKSTTAANVAIVFAQEGKKVLLVDTDLRKPTLHYTFNVPNTSGLTNLLTGQWHLNEVVKEPKIKGLNLILSGPIPPNPAELLNSDSMNIFIEEVSKQYDLVIFDSPPVLSVSDAQILANKCDGTILVISSGLTKKEHAVKAKEVLQASQATLIGAIFNNYKLEKDHYYYEYYG